MTYKVLNISTKEIWQGEAKNAKEAYSHIRIKSGDITTCNYGKYGFAVKEWSKNNRENNL